MGQTPHHPDLHPHHRLAISRGRHLALRLALKCESHIAVHGPMPPAPSVATPPREAVPDPEDG